MKRLYIIVDAFLDRSQQAVQACHAVAAFMLESQHSEKWNNGNIVLKKTKDLERWSNPCIDSDVVVFEEPYWNNRVTAVAAYRDEGYAEELPFV